MNADQREQVRSNAKYLREVRPIDPEEISEYVEGAPHPAAVRQVLRESAVELGLVERPDGTFEPVETGPVSVAFDGVDAFPERYGRVVEDLLVERFGPGWPTGESGDRIRSRIREVKADYLRGAPVEYDAETALCYALYHLPGYYAAVQYPLADLADDGLLGRRLRVLDVGAGVGGPALGVHDLLPEDSLIEYHAVEPSAAAEVFEAMLEATRPSFRGVVHRETAESFEPTGEYDLLLFVNVLSELADPVAVARRYCAFLAPDGSCPLLAPADLETATGLRPVERALENLFRNCVEHGSTGSRTKPDDSVEHGSTNPPSRARTDPVENDGGGTSAHDAREVSTEHGAPGERADSLEVRVGELRNRAGFFVADDGTGIPRPVRDRVFEPGFSTSDDGTGLGLSIVRRIVEAHGWEVDLTESETGGARFVVRGLTPDQRARQ
jgi:SAM-dependent methyltransferase